MSMNEKSSAPDNKIYIYESPDGGETIYRREFGAAHSERQLLKSKEENKSILVIEWSVDDVKQVRNDLSFSDACEVLNYISKNYDGKNGVSWSTIKEVTNILFPKKESDNETVKKSNFIFWNE